LFLLLDLFHYIYKIWLFIDIHMRTLRAPSLGTAHELVVKMLLEKGRALDTEEKEATVEFDEIGIRVENPLTEPMVSRHSRFSRRFMEKYAEDLLNGTPATFEYDYHDRLFNWGEELHAKEKSLHIDQIEYIIRKLEASPVSRRAIAITWNPYTDELRADCPCLQLVQCLTRDDRLFMKVVFRSNDMLTAAGANMFALVHLQQYIAGKLGVSPGPYTHISLVPHIYYKRDVDDIEPFCGRGEYIKPVEAVCRACGKCGRKER
jgi:thymidylate synthase